MLIDRSKEKLENAIIFFTTKTKYCYKVKLFKLLYFLDFYYYRDIGRSVTGLDYFAWVNGPVPVELDNEIKLYENHMSFEVGVESTLGRSLYIDKTITIKGEAVMIKPQPGITFNDSLFTERELEIMAELASLYHSSTSEEMIRDTHMVDSPWYRVFYKEDHKYQMIPYDYINDDAVIAELAKEHEEMWDNYSAPRDDSF